MLYTTQSIKIPEITFFNKIFNILIKPVNSLQFFTYKNVMTLSAIKDATAAPLALNTGMNTKFNNKLTIAPAMR